MSKRTLKRRGSGCTQIRSEKWNSVDVFFQVIEQRCDIAGQPQQCLLVSRENRIPFGYRRAKQLLKFWTKLRFARAMSRLFFQTVRNRCKDGATGLLKMAFDLMDGL